MKYKIRIALMVLFLCGLCYGAWNLYSADKAYRADREKYSGAVLEYVQLAGIEDAAPMPEDDADDGYVPIYAPLKVDFEKLSEDCPDIQGWIYCEGTNINYPVVQGPDNQKYLRHTYLGEYAAAGSIFLEAANTPGFQDSNNIIYGHHMKDKSMFAGLSNWAEQAYYDEHPVMWLLTPEQDYMVELFSGYITPAGSDVYAVFQGPSEWFDDYLKAALANSDFDCGEGFVPDGDAKYVVLSTCDYTFQNARYVLHGKLVPADRVEP